MSFYAHIIKPFLFRQDPEQVHNRATIIGKQIGRHSWSKNLLRYFFAYQNPRLTQEIDGTKFENPIGLSAGFDKNGELMEVIEAVGFGFMQVGTITDKPYAGNPKPRLTRLPNSQAILVNYGLKNEGANIITKRIQQRHNKNFPISVSIGKTNNKENADTDAGIVDQILCLRKVIESQVGDWYTLNISCPNTFGGEPFTTPDRLDKLLTAWFAENPKKPTYLKMPINLPWIDFLELARVADKHNVRGLIIGNLNKDKKSLHPKDTLPANAPGGISGKPTTELVNTLIQKTYLEFKNRFVLVGVGGVFNANDAYKKIRLGATLVQLITGMIYQGPALIGTINRDLVRLLDKDGFEHISEAIGADSKK